MRVDDPAQVHRAAARGRGERMRCRRQSAATKRSLPASPERRRFLACGFLRDCGDCRPGPRRRSARSNALRVPRCVLAARGEGSRCGLPAGAEAGEAELFGKPPRAGIARSPAGRREDRISFERVVVCQRTFAFDVDTHRETVTENRAPAAARRQTARSADIHSPATDAARGLDVMGLRATGSVDYTIDNALVLSNTRTCRECRCWEAFISPSSYRDRAGFALGIGRRGLDDRTDCMRRAAADAAVRGGGESFLELWRCRSEVSRRSCVGSMNAGTTSSPDALTARPPPARFAGAACAPPRRSRICAFAYRFGSPATRAAALLSRYERRHAACERVAEHPALAGDCWPSEGKVDRRALVDP